MDRIDQNLLPAGVQISGPINPGYEVILTTEALALVAKLHRAFNGRRQALLQARVARQARIDAGEMPDFLPETFRVRIGEWKIAPLPEALKRRHTEITGPVEAKMIINAYNSGADSYMADFEDSNSPKWENQIQGQLNIYKAIRRELTFTSEVGKEYRLNDKIATFRFVHAAGTSMRNMSPSMDNVSPAASSTLRSLFSTTPTNRLHAAQAHSSTCRSWNHTLKLASGMTYSLWRRIILGCRWVPSKPPC